MKQRKLWRLGLAMALVLVLLSGCSSARPLPEGMDEETAGQAGRDMVALLTAQDYQSVADAFRPDVKEQYQVTADTIRAAMDTVAGAGAYVKTDRTLAVGGRSESFSGDYASVIVYCEHEEEDVIYEMSFDPDLALLGLSVKEK